MRILLSIAACAALVSVIPIALGSGNGAAPGLSGGPAGYAGVPGNCTACHEFNPGVGGVALLGAPPRYEAGATYDLIVRVTDPEQFGAGFQISAEGSGGHAGTLLVSGDGSTQDITSGGAGDYITHSDVGLLMSIAQWEANGGSFDFPLQWRSPDADAGEVTFFVAAEAVNNAQAFFGDHYYATHAITRFDRPADANDDGVVDLADAALFQRCLSAAPNDEACAALDDDGDGIVSLSDLASFVAGLNGPTSTLAPSIARADVVRGGLLYDRWWVVAGLDAPTADHPLWSARPDPVSNARSGADTWRCKECHGWDYKGVDGAYGTGGHRTGIAGIWGTNRSAEAVIESIRDDHAYGGAGLGDDDVRDLARFVLDGLVDADVYLDGASTFTGDAGLGALSYNVACASCHGEDGTMINFGSETEPVYVGTVAYTNPWEFLHKVRHGQPGSPMPSTRLLMWDLSDAVNIGAFAQTLPR